MMRDFFLCRLDRVKNNVFCDVLLVYASGHTPDPDKLARSIKQEYEANLMPDEVIIIVADSELSQSKKILEKSRELTRLLLNSSRVNYYLCTFDSQGKQDAVERLTIDKSNIKFDTKNVKTQISFDNLYRQAITELYLRYHPIVETAENFHYIKPSGKHTDLFLRASKMFCSSAEVSFFALAAMPCLPQFKSDDGLPRYILIDTPVMIAFAQALIELIKLTVDQKIQVPSIEVISFRSFMGLRDNNEISELLNDLSENTLILISASTSGGLAAELKTQTKLPDKNIIHFLYLDSTPSVENEYSIICDLYFNEKTNPNGLKRRPQNFSAKQCHLCESSHAVQLIGDHFEAAPPKPSPITMLQVDAPLGKTKFHEQASRIFGKNTFRLGTVKYDRNRARHFHVDSNSLLNNQDLMDRLKYNLDISFPHDPQAFIYIDEDSKILAEKIASYTKASETVRLHRENIEDKLPIFPNCKRPIIICASVVESGRTLLEVSRDLRNIAAKTPLIYIIVVAKTLSNKRIETLKKSLSMTSSPVNHNVIIIEQIILPNATRSNSWLREEAFIKKHKLDGRNSFWRNRLSYLSVENGILKSDAPLFLTNGTKKENVINLQQGFVFYPDNKQLIKDSTNTDIYFCLSSVLQNLRTREPKKLRNSLKSNIYHQGLLAAENFTRYNDSVLQACLLRAALPSELNYINHRQESREIARIIKRVLLSSSTKRGAAAMEFLLAIGSGQLILRDQHIDDILSISSSQISELRVRELFKVITKQIFSGKA